MKITNTLFIFLLLSVSSFVAQTKVGTVDSEYILAYMPELKDVSKEVKTYSSQLDSTLNAKVSEYKLIVDDYKKREKKIKAKEKDKVVKKITNLESEITAYQSNGKRLVLKKQKELLRPLYKKISEAIQKVAKENSYTQILTLTGNEIAFIDIKYDITNLVFNKLDIPIPTEKNKEK